MINKIKSVLLLAALSLFSSAIINAENVGRYFPFSYRPEKDLYKRGTTADVDFFYASGRNIAQEDKAPLGMGEYAGNYDLRDIVFAMDQVNLPTGEIKQLVGEQLMKTSIPFNVHGKIRGGGGVLRYTWALPSKLPLSIGASLPIICVESDVRYSLNTQRFMQQYFALNQSIPVQPDFRLVEFYQERLDRARRMAHETIGLTNNYWVGFGVGDLDFFVRSNLLLDHKFMMRSIDIAVQYGIQIPTSLRRANNIVASIPFMNDGHWSLYAQIAPTFELKQDLKCGLLFRGQHFAPHTRERQIPVFAEPFMYSPLIGSVRVQPGSTFLCNAFLAMENVYDGLHLQGRYTYKRHTKDTWEDKRSDKTLPSYLSRAVTDGAPGDIEVTKKMIEDVISSKDYLSKFRSHYITIQLTYDPQEAGQNLPWMPKFFASFEAPMFDASRGVVQANQIRVGAELHF
ncbi:hypothetical protein FJ364_00045 [Candidatus Dependentiae bacterium]|nr:hypothetical protein [Candidatus Dependentiae bacterium]